MTTPAIITSIRNLIHDNATDKLQLAEDLTPQAGTPKAYLSQRPVVSGSEQITLNGVLAVKTTQYTIDYPTGCITWVGTPALPIIATYAFNDFTDDQLTTFVTSGLQFIGASTGPDNTYADLALVPQSLQEAVEHYAMHHAYNALATAAARLYRASSGKMNVDKDGIAKKFKDLADDNLKDAITIRDDFYKRQGRRNAPASGRAANLNPPWTPRR